MNDPAIDALSRAGRRSARLPAGAQCASCGTDQQLTLRPDGGVVCYADLQAQRGISAIELDHFAGRANFGGLVVPLRANSHRQVTDWRSGLGMDEWPTASADPLLLLAHLLGGIASLLLLVAEWLVAFAKHVAGTGFALPLGGPAFPVVP